MGFETMTRQRLLAREYSSRSELISHLGGSLFGCGILLVDVLNEVHFMGFKLGFLVCTAGIYVCIRCAYFCLCGKSQRLR